MKASLAIPTDMFVQEHLPVPYLRAARQARLLKEAGMEVSVVSWIDFDRALPEREERDGMSIRRMRLKLRGGIATRAVSFMKLRDKVEAMLLEERPDGIVCHDLELLWASTRAGRRLKIPVFYDSHEDFPAMVAEEKPLVARGFAALEKRLLPRVTHTYTVSEGIAEKFRRAQASVTVTYNSKSVEEAKADPGRVEELRGRLRIQEGDFVIGFAGGLNGERGLEQVIRLLPRLAREVRLVIVGGPATEAQRLGTVAGETGVAGRVALLPPVPTESLFDHLALFDLGLLVVPDLGPNYRFRAPNKLFDYMAAGVPTVHSEFPDMTRIAKDAGFGIPVNPEDPEALRGAIAGAIADGKRLESMGVSARKAFGDRYCWDKMKERMIASHPFWSGR